MTFSLTHKKRSAAVLGAAVVISAFPAQAEVGAESALRIQHLFIPNPWRPCYVYGRWIRHVGVGFSPGQEHRHHLP